MTLSDGTVPERAAAPAPRAAPPAAPVVVGVDGGPQAEPALRLAAGLARQQGSPLVLVHVVEAPRTCALWAAAVGIGALPREDYALEAFVQAAAVLDPLGVPWRLLVRHGDPALVLHRLARALQAAALVVGAAAPGRLRWSRRSTPARLTRMPGCRVLVADGREHDDRC